MNDDAFAGSQAFTPQEELRILLQWLGTIDSLSNYEQLQIEQIPRYTESQCLEAIESGVSIAEALCMMDPTIFKSDLIVYDEYDSMQTYNNFNMCLTGLV